MSSKNSFPANKTICCGMTLSKRILYDWTPILENRENAMQLNDALDIYYSIRDNRELLNSFRHNFIQQCYVVLYKNDVYAGDVFRGEDAPYPFETALHPAADNFESCIFSAVEAVWRALEDGARAERLIDRIKTYIDDAVRSDGTCLSRDRIAREFYINPNYLSSLFKAEEGESLSAYICRQRISLAKHLLEEDSDPISKICDRAGYVNAAYFAKVFKRETGMTPKEYRGVHYKR